MFESKNKYFGRKKGKSFLRLEQYTKYLVEPKKTLFNKIKTPRILEIGIGTVIGTSLTKDSMVDLQSLWRPAILITFTLVITGLAIGLWTSRLLNIDVITTILGAAPGGISGMSLVGSEYGVGAAVATLHAVRLITVLLILPLIVKCLNIFGVIKS